jgi:hypothetical protein
MKRPYSAIAVAVLLTSICSGCPALSKFFAPGDSSKRENDPAPERLEHENYPGSGADPREQRDWMEHEARVDRQENRLLH